VICLGVDPMIAMPRPVSFDEQPRMFTSPAQAMAILCRLRGALWGRCTLADLGVPPPGARRDQSAAIDAVAEIATFLRDCTGEERVALELEFAHPELPVADVPRRRAPRGYRPSRRTKVMVLTEEFGRIFGARTYQNLVYAGLGRVRRVMIAKDCLEPASWYEETSR